MITRDTKSYPVETKQGDEFCVMKPHSHKEVSLGLIKQGVTRITIDGEEFILKEGDLIFIPPEMVHLCIPVEIDKFNFVMYYIDNRWFSDQFNLELNNLRPISASTGSKGQIIIDSHKETKDAVIELVNNHLTFEKEDTITQKSLEEIRLYLEHNYKDDISLDSVSESYSINKYSLIRKFKKEFNLSPKAYIINLRINKSKDLLKDGMELIDVALNCGFYDSSHFIKTFKSYTGLTPENFR